MNGIAGLAKRLRDQISRRLFGLEETIELVLAAVFAGRHVLLEGVPGLGKTLLMKTLSTSLGCDFKRIQFTPDLLPADILGGFVYDARDSSFKLRRGPIFANVVLADEINRAPAKTQSALLEVMQEQQVTIEGERLEAPRPFLVFATQNPLEHEGVYPLPQAQLDRFGLRIILTHPAPEEEKRILSACREPEREIEAVTDPQEVLAVQAATEEITVSNEIIDLLVALVNQTRHHEGVALGASPRVGVDLVHLARARALLDGRGSVIPDDVKALFFHVANHRLMLTPQAEIRGLTPQQVIEDALRATRLI